jgi:hypothetical protein
MGVLVCAVIIVAMGVLGVFASMSSIEPFQPTSDATMAIRLLVNPVISLMAVCVGLGLRALRHWALISALVYFGTVAILGVLSGLGGLAAGWLGVLIAAPVALYLWARRDPFGGADANQKATISLTHANYTASVASSKPVPTSRGALYFLSAVFYLAALATFAFPFLSFASWSGTVTTVTGLQLATGTPIHQPETLIPMPAGPSWLMLASSVSALLGIAPSFAETRFSEFAGMAGLLAIGSLFLLRYRLFTEVFTASNGSYKLITESGYAGTVLLLLVGALWSRRGLFVSVEPPDYLSSNVGAS